MSSWLVFCRVSISTMPRSTPGYVHAALVSFSALAWSRLSRHVVDLALGLHGLLGVVEGERKGHLTLPAGMVFTMEERIFSAMTESLFWIMRIWGDI